MRKASRQDQRPYRRTDRCSAAAPHCLRAINGSVVYQSGALQSRKRSRTARTTTRGGRCVAVWRRAPSGYVARRASRLATRGRRAGAGIRGGDHLKPAAHSRVSGIGGAELTAVSPWRLRLGRLGRQRVRSDGGAKLGLMLVTEVSSPIPGSRRAAPRCWLGVWSTTVCEGISHCKCEDRKAHARRHCSNRIFRRSMHELSRARELRCRTTVRCKGWSWDAATASIVSNASRNAA